MASQRRVWAVAAVLLGLGCASVPEPDITGPHGEHLTKIQCGWLDECVASARATCGGDYDVISQNGTGKGILTMTMLVACNAPPALGRPDSGR
jgi:hypothetical protein